jgi:hypothetical protein
MKILIAAAVFALALPLAAQNKSTNCVDASTLEEKHGRGGIVGGAQRVMGMPSTTVDAPDTTNVCPLSAHQKLSVWAKRSYSPTNLLAAGFSAAIWQATDSDPRDRGYGQGWEAYGARYGASLATAESTHFFQSFLLPSIFKQDPRYFRKRTGGFGSRFAYSISRVLVTRTDAGHQAFNISAVGGALGGTALANLYLPKVDQDGGRNAVFFGLSMANTAGWNLWSEFGPNIWGKLRGKDKK